MPVKFSNVSQMRLQEVANTLNAEKKENIPVPTNIRNNKGQKNPSMKALPKNSTLRNERKSSEARTPVTRANVEELRTLNPANSHYRARILRANELKNEGKTNDEILQANLKNFTNSYGHHTGRKITRKNGKAMPNAVPNAMPNAVAMPSTAMNVVESPEKPKKNSSMNVVDNAQAEEDFYYQWEANRRGVSPLSLSRSPRKLEFIMKEKKRLDRENAEIQAQKAMAEGGYKRKNRKTRKTRKNRK